MDDTFWLTEDEALAAQRIVHPRSLARAIVANTITAHSYAVWTGNWREDGPDYVRPATWTLTTPGHLLDLANMIANASDPTTRHTGKVLTNLYCAFADCLWLQALWDARSTVTVEHYRAVHLLRSL